MAAPAVEAQAEFSLHAVVTAALDDFDELSPKEIAQRIALEMAEEHLRSALETALGQYIGTVMRRGRHGVRNIGEPGATGGKRWEKVSEDLWEIELLRQRVCPRGVYKRFGECDIKDVVDLGADHELLAERSAHLAQRHKVLAKLMSTRGLATVADVPKEDLRKIFNA